MVKFNIYIHAHSPTDTSRSYTWGEETNETTVSNAQYDKVVYAAPTQPVIVPHQASAAGELYAVSTKTINKKSKEQSLWEQPLQEDIDIVDSKKVEGVRGS